MRKIVVLNGSPREHGNTAALVEKVVKTASNKKFEIKIKSMNDKETMHELRCEFSILHGFLHKTDRYATFKALLIVSYLLTRKVFCVCSRIKAAAVKIIFTHWLNFVVL